MKISAILPPGRIRRLLFLSAGHRLGGMFVWKGGCHGIRGFAPLSKRLSMVFQLSCCFVCAEVPPAGLVRVVSRRGGVSGRAENGRAKGGAGRG